MAEVNTKKKPLLDIFKVFTKINSGDLNYFASLTAEEQKSISPLVLLMWMQNSSMDGQVLYLNEFVNRYLFSSLKDEPEAAFMMLQLGSRINHDKRYQWKKRCTNKGRSDTIKNVLGVLCQYFEEPSHKLSHYLDRMSIDDFLGICDELGIQDDEKKKLKKEFEKVNG